MIINKTRRARLKLRWNDIVIEDFRENGWFREEAKNDGR